MSRARRGARHLAPPVARHPVHPAGGRQQLRRHHRRLDARRPGRPAARRGRAPGAGRQPRAGRPRRTPRAPRRRTGPARGGKTLPVAARQLGRRHHLRPRRHAHLRQPLLHGAVRLRGRRGTGRPAGHRPDRLLRPGRLQEISSRATRTTSARPNWFAPGSSSTARNSRRASASPPPPTTANPASRW